MNKAALSVLFGAVSLAWVVGCGGNVTSGTGGDGGGGSGGSGGSGSTSTTDTTTSSTDPQSLCESACNIAKTAGCYDTPVSDCVNGCVQTFNDSPQCAAQVAAVYQCAIDKVPSGGCDVETLCKAEDDAAKKCLYAGCSAAGCDADGTSCSCDASCNGAAVLAECSQGATTIDCTCYVNDAVVGTCTDTNLACDVEQGCCAQFF